MDQFGDNKVRNTSDEDKLFRQICKDDPRAFQALMKKYFRKLVDFANYYVKSHDLAKDVVQDVFANIWERRSTLELKHSAKLYLYQSVKNEALNTVRNQDTEVKYMKAYMIEQEERMSTQDEPVESISNFDIFEQEVHKAIESLPERARMVYKLHRRDGLTYKEIARVMKISHKTVESQMSRSLKLLRIRLSDYFPSISFAFFVKQIFC